MWGSGRLGGGLGVRCWLLLPQFAAMAARKPAPKRLSLMERQQKLLEEQGFSKPKPKPRQQGGARPKGGARGRGQGAGGHYGRGPGAAFTGGRRPT